MLTLPTFFIFIELKIKMTIRAKKGTSVINLYLLITGSINVTKKILKKWDNANIVKVRDIIQILVLDKFLTQRTNVNMKKQIAK